MQDFSAMQTEDPNEELKRELPKLIESDKAPPMDPINAWRLSTAAVAEAATENLRPLYIRVYARRRDLVLIDASNQRHGRMRYEHATTREEAERNMFHRMIALAGLVGIALRNMENFRIQSLKVDVDSYRKWSFRDTGAKKRQSIDSDHALEEWFNKVPEDESFTKNVVHPEIQALSTCKSRLDLVMQTLEENESANHLKLSELEAARQQLSDVLLALEKIVEEASALGFCFLPGQAPGRPGTDFLDYGIPVEDDATRKQFQQKCQDLRLRVQQRIRARQIESAQISGGETCASDTIDFSTVNSLLQDNRETSGVQQDFPE